MSFTTTTPLCTSRMPLFCQAISCLFTLSRDMPTIWPSSRWVMRTEPGGAPGGLGEAAVHVAEGHVLHLLAGAAEPGAEQLDHLQRDRRAFLDEGDEIPPVDDQQLAVRHGRGVGRAGMPVEQRDLPQKLSGSNQIEDNFPAVGRGRARLDGAADDHDERLRGVALAEQHRALPDPLGARKRGQAVAVRRVERGEEGKAGHER
jgi:hypothetical protein